MDFDLSPDQAHRIDRLRDIVAATAPSGLDALPDHFDAGVAQAIGDDAMLTGHALTLLDRTLLVEAAAAMGAPFDATTSLLIGPLCGAEGPATVRVAGGRRSRSARPSTALIEVTDSRAAMAETVAGSFEPSASGLVTDFGSVQIGPLREVEWPLDLSPVGVYRLGRAAEVAGVSRTAIAVTSEYLQARRQFGQPLAQFQALRHRIAEHAVDASGCAALVHQAGHSGRADDVAAAVLYAVTTAAMAPDLHQLCGARGFMADFGLSRFTMALVAARVELGGTTETTIAYADAVWPDSEATP